MTDDKDSLIEDLTRQLANMKRHCRRVARALHVEDIDPESIEEAIRHRLAVDKAVFRSSRMFLAPSGTELNEILEILARGMRASRAFIVRVRHGGRTVDHVHEWKAPDVDPRFLRSIMTVPVPPGNQESKGYIGFEDIHPDREWLTEDRHAIEVVAELLGLYWERERIMRELRNKLELQERVRHLQKIEAIGQLAGGVAHELNNPLGVILGFAQSAKRRLDDGDPLWLPLLSIEREALRCRTLIADLLTFSTKSTEEHRPARVSRLLETTRALVERRARERSVAVEVRYDANMPDVKTDFDRLQQALVCLADNALDAMPTGGILQITSALAESHVIIWVTDTGSGMSAETQIRIFDPFFTTKELGEGSGLGLTLAQEIVKQHSGMIECHSTPGKGTVFTITLPAVSEKHSLVSSAPP